MKKTIVVLSFCLTTVFVNAQTSGKQEKIKQMLELTGAGKLGIQVMNQMMTNFKSTYSKVNQQFWEDFKNEVKADDIVNLMIPIYDKYYTEHDIEQLILFYKSPVGQKTISVNPLITKESMITGQQWGMAVGKKVIEKLEEKGFSVN